MFDEPLRTLAGDLADRCAATEGERRAARWLVSAVRRQTHQVWVEPFRSFRSPRPAWALLLTLALAGGMLVWPAPWAGVCLTLLAALGFAGQAMSRLELGWLFGGGESQNVVGVIPSREEVRQRVVVLTHYDTGSPLWTRLTFVGVALAMGLLPLAAMLCALMAAPLWDLPVLAPLAGVALGLAALLRPGWPGGNAAGVAAALAVGQGAPLEHTEVWTVFTGSRYPGLVGIRAFLRRHGRLLAEARFIILQEEDGTGATREAAVVAERVHGMVTLLTVAPGDIGSVAASVRLIAETINRAACD